ncbi:hypothetical protein [Mycobacterium sp. 852002-50816_SCH5313054-b]|uniref:hypothetical protein n=1 Tax=Mycobacterium sp. 852002-50816_SCH5313054-b TaxID=1834092 RepID=UPI0012EA309D|nr:hypothetical protein [Mycobacterium sp. 852002-50816_SCH5313054-b]
MQAKVRRSPTDFSRFGRHFALLFDSRARRAISPASSVIGNTSISLFVGVEGQFIFGVGTADRRGAAVDYFRHPLAQQAREHYGVSELNMLWRSIIQIG